MGKNTGNLDLVCENIIIHHECEGGIEKKSSRGSPIGITRLVY